MKLTPHQYAKTLFESLQDTAAKDHEKVLDNFVEALILNNDTAMFEKIALEYDKIDKNAKGIKIAEVTSANPLDKKTEHMIIDQLNDLVKAKVELKTKLDKNILGGVVVRLEDTLIDASVRTSLDELKKDLKQ